MRTHALVSLGAALVTLSSIQVSTHGGVIDSNSVSRAVQGIVAGIGFLGGGVILKANDRTRVRYLTTAASIWIVACLGIVCGAGQWALAVSALGLSMLVLILGGPVEGLIRRLVGAPEHHEGHAHRAAHARRRQVEAEAAARSRAMRADDDGR
jgi:putative Mg2+ transporter-C (MgtC) family protein